MMGFVGIFRNRINAKKKDADKFCRAPESFNLLAVLEIQ